MELISLLWLALTMYVTAGQQNLDLKVLTMPYLGIAGAFVPLFLVPVLANVKENKAFHVLALLLFEIGSLTWSGGEAIKSGAESVYFSAYGLVILIIVAKAGLLFGRRTFSAFLLISLAAQVFFNAISPSLLGQRMSGVSENWMNIFGRDLIAYIFGASIVAVTVEALVKEGWNRWQLEILAERLDELAAEIERNRIAQEVNSSVDHLIESLHQELVHLWQLRDSQPEVLEETLVRAKELSGTSIAKVREALVAMREVRVNQGGNSYNQSS